MVKAPQNQCDLGTIFELVQWNLKKKKANTDLRISCCRLNCVPHLALKFLG
jgi:hypothetical protein